MGLLTERQRTQPRKQRLDKSLYQEAKQDQTKRVAQESRRGSVRWDTMERLNDQTSEVNIHERGL